MSGSIASGLTAALNDNGYTGFGCAPSGDLSCAEISALIASVPRIKVQAIIIGPKELNGKEPLRSLLEAHPGVSIEAECEWDDATSVVGRYDPDLLVLDLRTQDAKTFLLENNELGAERPFVLIVADDKLFLVRAFEMHAVDCILTPFDGTRFCEPLARVRRGLQRSRYARLGERLIHLLRQGHGHDAVDQLVVRTNGRLVFLNSGEIDWIGAAANYVQLHVGSGSYQMRETIGHLSERLDGRHFVRIHRSIIVNVSRIRELEPVNSGEYIVTLKNGKELSCSRGFRNELDRFISKCV